MSVNIQTQPNRAAFDVRNAQDLRSRFASNTQEGIKAAAQQFETLFLQMVVKSMRDATPQDGVFDSEQTRFYTGLLDQQLAQNLSTQGKGLGFARLIEQQLGRTMTSQQSANGTTVASGQSNSLPLATMDSRHLQYSPVLGSLPTSSSYVAINAKNGMSTAAASDVPASAQEFVGRVWPHAVEASRSTGIAPQFLVAHAALESGWGKNEIRSKNGGGSYNLFGIKAGKGWTGPSVEATTTEYVDGQAQQVVERFRSYASYDEAFRDYANLLRNNARFGSVVGSQDGTTFANSLQRAGYATDPNYAEKLTRIINGPTLRMALTG